MSPPIWLRDTIFNDKKIKNNQNKNFHTISNKKPNDSDRMVSDLLGELQNVMCENAKLQSKNQTLQTTVNELKTKYDDLMESVELNKSKFEIDLGKLQEEIKNNEAQLIENSKKCLQQQKKHIQEIKRLKSENELLHIEITKNETEFLEKVKTFENEMRLLQLSYSNVQSLNEENAQKATRYKNKLKSAVTIINDLNNMLVHCSAKPDLNHQETQTHDGHPMITQSFHNTQSYIVPHQQNLETENLLLSEVFFKSRAFCDNEILLFNDKESD